MIQHFALSMKKLRILKIPNLHISEVSTLVKNNPNLEQVGNWEYILVRQRTGQFDIKCDIHGHPLRKNTLNILKKLFNSMI